LSIGLHGLISRPQNSILARGRNYRFWTLFLRRGGGDWRLWAAHSDAMRPFKRNQKEVSDDDDR
jgi:hypothetical protein